MQFFLGRRAQLRAGSIQAAVVLALIPAIAAAAGARFESRTSVSRRSLADTLRYGPGIANHPVHVVPSAAVRIPESWPLAPDGSITCSTCHERLPELADGSDPYLRLAQDWNPAPAGSHGSQPFCANCHAANTPQGSSMHWTAVGSAHIKPDSERSGGVGSGHLDAESRRCLACHDGVTAHDTRHTTAGRRGSGYIGDSRRSHPVGVGYPSHTPRNYSVPFRPVALLPARVRLPEGRVSCVSCHDLYGTGTHHLSVPIEGSALCFTCHQLD